MPETTIDILRHGRPRGGTRYRGHGIDDPLSETGSRQMWAAVGDRWPWQHIITSPMARCLAFAEALAGKADLPVTVDARLREVGFGSWEGHTGDEIRARDPDAIRRFYADPVAARPEGAEPLDEFRQRVSDAIQHIMDTHTGEQVLVVAHAGVMRATISWLLDAPLQAMYRVDIPNAAFLHVRTGKERPPMMVFRGPALE